MDIPIVFIGYDSREQNAANVAAWSLRRRSTCHLRIYPLEHRLLRRAGLFDRPWRIDEAGQFWDDRDGRPFSTEFSHSRFLVFHLAQQLKATGPCMFVDCDWHFLDDIEPLMAMQTENPDKIGVVNRDRKVDEGSSKMDGMVQQNYHRKLWSALFTFTPSEELAVQFSTEVVNKFPGRELHAFMGRPDDAFWEIDPAWHFIPSLDERPDEVKGVHYSEFSPWLNPERFEDAPDLFSRWHAAFRELKRVEVNKDVQLFDNLMADLVDA